MLVELCYFVLVKQIYHIQIPSGCIAHILIQNFKQFHNITVRFEYKKFVLIGNFKRNTPLTGDRYIKYKHSDVYGAICWYFRELFQSQFF